MNELRDEDERLGMRLRAIPVPEPSPDFLAGARRRYLAAMEARYRREALTGLGASFALALAASVLLSAFTPASVITWFAATMASLATSIDALGIVLSVVPPVAWPSAMVVSLIALLSAASLLRVRSLVAVK